MWALDHRSNPASFFLALNNNCFTLPSFTPTAAAISRCDDPSA
jgi:hypothetical protein